MLGASWAIVLFGALIVFRNFLFLGLPSTIFLTLLYVFTTYFMILGLDAFVINRQKLIEAKKQTKLLEELLGDKDA